jgi:hypothetical protein
MQRASSIAPWLASNLWRWLPSNFWRWLPSSLWRWLPSSLWLGVASSLWLGGCASSGGQRWRDHDVLKSAVPTPPRTLRGVSITEAEYQHFRLLGERWFRSETFGGERSTTDIAGLFGAELEVPCAGEPPPAPGCRRQASVLHYFVQALDRLDGVPENLFDGGNGGPLGPGFTNDLVIEFPPGTTLAGLPVPERVHTGLDVDAGSPWPIGVVAVAAPAADQALPYLIEPAALGVGSAPAGKVRLGIACALCHYSLDVDKDGQPDVRSSRWGEYTPGSAYGPEHTWGIGNQDVHFGWLFAFTRNPLMGFTVLSGPVGRNDPKASLEWVRWVKEHYRAEPEAVRREVIRGMLVQPRGYADDTPNALHDPNQIPVLFTLGNWPYNFEGSFIDPSDRNNGVWTGAIDFTGLISLSRDRSGGAQGALFWEPKGVYSVLDAEEYADMLVDRSPAVAFDPAQREPLKRDILGTDDGIPSVLDPFSVVVMRSGIGAIPRHVLDKAESLGRVRDVASYGRDAEVRGSMLTLLGTRVITRPAVRQEVELDRLLERYPALNADDFESDVVSLFLDSLTPPANQTALLRSARDQVARGYEVFVAEGCASCHRGPYLTDNSMHRLSAWRADEVGTAAASTAGFRPLGRGSGPALDTAPYRALATRPLKLYVAPGFDPDTGRATGEGGILRGLFGDPVVGYKTVTLRYVWGSAPYLHDGGVGVGLAPGAAPPGSDLRTLLARPAADKLYGMARILAWREQHQSTGPWPDAALSLQALLLESERRMVIQGNRAPIIEVPIGGAENPLAAPAQTSFVLLGVEGRGHEFWVDDEPGGERITALVAFLLALDDAPGVLP